LTNLNVYNCYCWKCYWTPVAVHSASTASANIRLR